MTTSPTSPSTSPNHEPVYVLRTPTGRPMIIMKGAVTVYRGKKEIASFTAIYEQASGPDYLEQGILDAVAGTVSNERIKIHLPE